MIDKIGWVISKVSRLPKLESFFSIQMMFLGNTEALAVIRGQLAVLKDNRLLTFGIMSMSKDQRIDSRFLFNDGSCDIRIYRHPAKLLKCVDLGQHFKPGGSH